MLKFNYTLIFLLLFKFSYSQTPDCAHFHNGRFIYPSMPGKLSVRKDTVQESYNNGKLEMIWKVKWFDDCTYELTCRDVFVEQHSGIKKGDRIKATIIKTDEDCFTTTLLYFNAGEINGVEIPSGPMCFEHNYPSNK